MVPLAAIIRSGFKESVHFGSAVVVGPDGRVLRSLGDITTPIYPRSTLKFLQAISVLECGVELEGSELVLAAASHRGTVAHVAVVESILTRAGLDESALQCPADWPSDAGARRNAAAASRLAMNCSGKHAAFLLACVRNDWDLATYLDPHHPLQERIRETTEAYTGVEISHTGVDGCGAPVHAVSLEALGRAIGAVVRGTTPASELLTTAIRKDAWALDTSAVARMIDELGLIAKTGAEGVFVAAAHDGTTVALKIGDGSSRASIPVALALLASAGAVDPTAAAAVLAATTERVLGGGEPVGELVCLV